jgi:hypothetical protein
MMGAPACVKPRGRADLTVEALAEHLRMVRKFRV